jgi:hypothetical protein
MLLNASYLQGKAEMKQTKVRPDHPDLDFNDVAAVADRMVWTGRPPTVSAICEELNTACIDRVRQCFALWKAGYNHSHAQKTHILDLPSEFQHLLAEGFERRIIASEAKLKAECAEIRADRDRLAKINEHKDAQIQALMLALGDAEVKIADQARRISRLRKGIAEGRDALRKAEQRTGYAPAGINESGIHV